MWKYIIIHHSVTDGSYETGLNVIKNQEKNYGKNSNSNAYHYMVTEDGRIIRWKPENVVVGHCGYDGYSYSEEPCNLNSLGVCFLGNFQYQDIPKKQLEAGMVLIKALVKKYNIQDIYGHRDIVNTQCPGDYLYNKIPDIKKQVLKALDWREEVINFNYEHKIIKDKQYHLERLGSPMAREEIFACLMNLINTIDKEKLKEIVNDIIDKKVEEKIKELLKK